MRQGTIFRPSFSDFPTYRKLLEQKGCFRVDITRVICYHSKQYVRGLQVTYRAKFMNGTIQECVAPEHIFNR